MITKETYDSRCHRFSHYEGDEPVFVYKKAFDSYSEAINSANRRNSKKSTSQQVSAYKCPVCGKFHVGSIHVVYSRKDKPREKQRTIARKYLKYKRTYR